MALQAIGGQLTYRIGPMPEVLEELHLQCGIDVIWSHQETGNRITLERNQRVRRWVKETGLEWNEIAQHGVVRGLKSRDGWAAHWNTSMSRPLAQRPSRIVAETRVETGAPATPEQLGLDPSEKTELQVGGESKAISVLKRFLHDRGRNYRNEMSSPVTAWQSCSRLSPYLTWGCISIKTVAQQLRGRQVELREQKSAGKDVGPWLGSLSAFRSRLNWHCHFIQKLEDEPSIEWQNMSRAYDGLREDEFNPEFLAAWSAGQTGYPMVDSCMRALKQHSWINFRMRAMLVSFASYHLWLDWRPTAQFLAKHFLDFEPGIHYPQIQMQSGTTGINAVRIYSPIKQVKDHDPQGVFIRRYVPELAAVPDEYLAEPHKMPLTTQRQSGCIMGKRIRIQL